MRRESSQPADRFQTIEHPYRERRKARAFLAKLSRRCRCCCQPFRLPPTGPAGLPCSLVHPPPWLSRWSCPTASLLPTQPGSSTRLPPAAAPHSLPRQHAWQALAFSSWRPRPPHPARPRRVPNQPGSRFKVQERAPAKHLETMPATRAPENAGPQASGADMRFPQCQNMCPCSHLLALH